MKIIIYESPQAELLRLEEVQVICSSINFENESIIDDGTPIFD